MSESESVKSSGRLAEIICTSDPVALTAPFRLKDKVFIGYYAGACGPGCLEVPEQDLSSVGESLYLSSDGHIIVHGLKRIWESLEIGDPDLDPKLITDTKLMAYMLDPDLGKEQDLIISNLVHLYELPEYPYRILDIRDQGYPKAVYEGLAQDAEIIYELSGKLQASMTPKLMNIYRHIELPLMLLLNEMRRTGIGVDRTGCSKEKPAAEHRLIHLEKEITGGAEVNLNSHRETFRFLVDQGVRFADPFVYTSQKATSDDLEEIAYLYPVAEKILEWRALRDDLIFLETGSQTDRIHPKWGQTRAATGRIYARKPAVQNVRRDLRRFFIPAPGHVFIKADYSQAQLRILAYLSEDETLMKLYKDPNGDAHTATSEWLGLDDRSIAKEINFAICYGMSAAGLASKVNEVKKEQAQPFIDEAMAQAYIDGFYHQYPGIADFFDREWENLKKLPLKDRLVMSPAGRTRRFPTRANKAVERQFRVTPPQMMEADILKTAAVRLNRIFRRRKMGVRIVMLIHDAIWIEAPIEEKEEVHRLMEKIMSTAGQPFLDLKVGFSD